MNHILEMPLPSSYISEKIQHEQTTEQSHDVSYDSTIEGKRNDPDSILLKRKNIKIPFLLLAQEIQTGEQTIQFSSGKVADRKQTNGINPY